jgi:hypothetical protein
MMAGDCTPEEPGKVRSEDDTLAGDAGSPDRRELIKKLGKAALLPALVATFVASDATDAAAY